jgi:DNA (cytosine-5)-methyltransferase 1
MRTVSAGGNHHGVVEPPEPLYVKNYGPAAKAAPMSGPVRRPLGAITGTDHHGLLQPPLLVQAAGNTYDRPGGGYIRVRVADKPLWTQQGTPTTALVTSYYGREDATRPTSDPLGTVTGDPRHALVVPVNGGRHGDGGHKVRSTDEPLLTQTGDLARALVVPTDQVGPNRHNRARPAEEPLRTQTSIQADALVVPAGSTWRRDATAAAEPLPTRTATGVDGGCEAPAAFLTSYYRTSQPTSVQEPLSTLTGRHRHALTEGPAIAVEDCYFRMLEPHEIQAGMAFPAAYAVLGNKRERVRQLGQAVTPPVLRWIVGRIVESLR